MRMRKSLKNMARPTRLTHNTLWGVMALRASSLPSSVQMLAHLSNGARLIGWTQQIQKSPTHRVRLFCIWRARHDSNV